MRPSYWFTAVVLLLAMLVSGCERRSTETAPPPAIDPRTGRRPAQKAPEALSRPVDPSQVRRPDVIPHSP